MHDVNGAYIFVYVHDVSRIRGARSNKGNELRLINGTHKHPCGVRTFSTIR